MAEYGLTTLGIELWVAESANGEKVTTGSAYSRLTRINSIGEVSLTANNIDVSAIEDYISHYKAGRSDVSDTFAVGYLPTDETNAEWTAILNKKVCFLIKIPNLTTQGFIIAQVPAKLPMPAIESNSAFTSTINCTVNDFIGFDTAVSNLGGTT